MELFTLRELQALEGTLTGSLSGRTNDLMWTASEHIELTLKVQKLVAEREDREFSREALPGTEPERRTSASA